MRGSPALSEVTFPCHAFVHKALLRHLHLQPVTTRHRAQHFVRSELHVLASGRLQLVLIRCYADVSSVRLDSALYTST